MFNGDVMTAVDVNAVVELHRERQAKATIVLTPVDNPTAYGLVETDADGRVRRFLEKPKPDEITCDTINAGIYVLEPDTFDRIPKDVSYSIERGYFPSLIERGETFVAYIDRGYWIDIGTPEKYIQVHRDMFDGRFDAGIYRGVDRHAPLVSPEARVDDGATLVGALLHRRRRAHQDRRRASAPYAVIGRGVVVEEGAHVCSNTILWPNTRIGQNAVRRRPDHRPQLPHRPQRVDQGQRRARRQDHAHRLHPRIDRMAIVNPAVFKAYDVRGLYPTEITEDLFHQLGRAFVAYLGPGRYAVSRDMRVSSPALAAAFIDGARLQGGHDRRLRPDGHRPDVLRGRRRRPRWRRADHRVAQPGRVQRLQDGPQAKPSR